MIELAKHPWIQDAAIENGRWPTMEVREAEDPKTMSEDEIWTIPK